MTGGAGGIDAVLGALGDEGAIAGDEAARWSSGWPAEAVAFPESVEEVEALVRVAAEVGCSLLPAGFGRWLGAGGWTRRPTVVVSTERLGGVRLYEPADLTITAGAGLASAALDDLARERGQWFAVEPPGFRSGTVGAAVACGATGPLRGRCGAMRDNVLGLRVVNGEGKTLRLGGRVVKNVAGYDLVRLFVGSRGSLGVITEASLRLFPRPALDRTLLFAAPRDAIVGAARAAATSAPPVAAVQVVEGVEAAGGADAVAVRLLGGEREVDGASASLGARIDAATRATADSVAVLDADASERFHARVARWEDEARFVARIRALPDRLADSLTLGRSLATSLDGGGILADALDGSVRVRGSLAGADADALAAALLETRARMRRWGGTLTLARAPRDLAERVGWTTPSSAGAGVSARLKSLFDPRGVFAAAIP